MDVYFLFPRSLVNIKLYFQMSLALLTSFNDNKLKNPPTLHYNIGQCGEGEGQVHNQVQRHMKIFDLGYH